MYELIILSHLMRYNAHGYLIAKIINDMIGPYARVSNGRLYPLLSKLEGAGLIAVDTETAAEQQGDRQLRTYKITEAGRRRFHELMMDTTSNPGEYQKLFPLKAHVFEFLKPVERLRLIDHYINYCQAHVLHLMAEADDLVREVADHVPPWSPARLDAVLNVMQHMIDQWQLELDWAKNLREKEVTEAKQAENVMNSIKGA